MTMFSRSAPGNNNLVLPPKLVRSTGQGSSVFGIAITLSLFVLVVVGVATRYDVLPIVSLALIVLTVLVFLVLNLDIRWFVLMLIIASGFQADYPIYRTSIDPLGSTAYGRILAVDFGIVLYFLKRSTYRFPGRPAGIFQHGVPKVIIPYLFAGLIAWEVLSLANSVYVDVSLFQILSSVRVLLCMVIVLDFVRAENDIWWVVKGLLLIYLVHTVFAGIQLLNGGPLGLSVLGETQVDFRGRIDIGGVVEGVYVSGFAGGPYSLAGYLVLILPLLFSLLFIREWAHRRLIAIMFGWGILLLILTGSRGALIGFASSIAAMVTAMVIQGRLKVRISTMAGILVMLMIVGFLFGERIYLRFFVSNLTESFGVRTLLTQEAFEFAAQNPLLGVGIGNFSPLVAGESYLFGPSGRPAHNMIALWLSEIGFPGALLLVACWLWALFVSYRLFRSPSIIGAPLSFVGLGLFGSFVGVIVHAQTDIVFRNAVIFLQYGICLGLTAGLVRLNAPLHRHTLALKQGG